MRRRSIIHNSLFIRCSLGKHAAAICKLSLSHRWGSAFRSILDMNHHYDCLIEVDCSYINSGNSNTNSSSYISHSYNRVAAIMNESIGNKKSNDVSISSLSSLPYSSSAVSSASSSSSTTTSSSFLCHRSVLSVRSHYLCGYIKAHMREIQRNSIQHLNYYNHHENQHQQNNDNNDVSCNNDIITTSISLPSIYANHITIKALLNYFYTDRIQILHHKKKDFFNLAQDLNIHHLLSILSDQWYQHNHFYSSSSISSSSSSIANNNNNNIHYCNDDLTSTFLNDLLCLYDSQLYCDIIFVIPKANNYHSHFDHDLHGHHYHSEYHHQFNHHDYSHYLYAHKFIICSRMPYFQGLLSGKFIESSHKVIISSSTSTTNHHQNHFYCNIKNDDVNTHDDDKRDNNDGKYEDIYDVDSSDDKVIHSVATVVDLSGIMMEGYEWRLLVMIIKYCYVGHFKSEDDSGECLSSHHYHQNNL